MKAQSQAREIQEEQKVFSQEGLTTHPIQPGPTTLPIPTPGPRLQGPDTPLPAFPKSHTNWPGSCLHSPRPVLRLANLISRSSHSNGKTGTHSPLLVPIIPSTPVDQSSTTQLHSAFTILDEPSQLPQVRCLQRPARGLTLTSNTGRGGQPWHRKSLPQSFLIAKLCGIILQPVPASPLQPALRSYNGKWKPRCG